MTVASATKASSQLLWQLLMALGARIRANGDDDGAGDDRREELHHLADAERGDQAAEQHVDQAGQRHSRAGVGQVLGVGTAVRHDGEAAQIRKAGSQERGHLALAQEVEQQRAQTCAEQCGADAQAGQQRHQHGCAEHCKHVLYSKQQHFRGFRAFWRPEFPWFLVIVHSYQVPSLLFFAIEFFDSLFMLQSVRYLQTVHLTPSETPRMHRARH